MLQVKGSYRGLMQDGDHTGHNITMFAEQLTRTFEVLVFWHSRTQTKREHGHGQDHGDTNLQIRFKMID